MLRRKKRGGSQETGEGLFALDHLYEYTRMSQIAWGSLGKYISTLCVCLYIYGSVTIKLVLGARSLAESLSFLIYRDMNELYRRLPFDPYYIALVLFTSMVFYYTLGNIESTGQMQRIIAYIRCVILAVMIGTCCYVIWKYPMRHSPIPSFVPEKAPHIFSVFVYYAIIQHTVLGMTQPARPERSIRSTLFIAYTFCFLLVSLMACLGIYAFGSAQPDCRYFPCKLKVNSPHSVHPFMALIASIQLELHRTEDSRYYRQSLLTA